MLKKIVLFLMLAAAIDYASALELRAHALELPANDVGSIEVRNPLNYPIVVRVQPPEGVQAFPRRVRLLPGGAQVIKARGSVSEKAFVRFSYAAEREKQGGHARLTLRLPVKEVGDGS
jgi:hypothetical protein